ncbi:MAG: 50S ribosomal protein L18 [Clostridiales bacterium]|nr:50S ribosomal protein L18 [Clostridiales bacterium]
MAVKLDRKKRRERIHRRVRKKVSGTASRPRLSVHKSLKHMRAQIIDDTAGMTLVAASTEELKSVLDFGGNIEAAKELGKLIAKKALEKSITTVVFDRGGCIYHGRIKALAEAAREAGLKF